jgi:hypothetical protein
MLLKVTRPEHPLPSISKARCQSITTIIHKIHSLGVTEHFLYGFFVRYFTFVYCRMM